LIETNDVRIILTTCGDRAEAERIGRSLVESRLSACINILPGIQSIYWWQGKIESSLEVLLLIKTRSEQVEAVEKAVSSLHSYATPEFLVVAVTGGSSVYLEWLQESLK
jgi:periplasmic divalent cation tolerance protein